MLVVPVRNGDLRRGLQIIGLSIQAGQCFQAVLYEPLRRTSLSTVSIRASRRPSL
jgi:hypothetical protein